MFLKNIERILCRILDPNVLSAKEPALFSAKNGKFSVKFWDYAQPGYLARVLFQKLRVLGAVHLARPQLQPRVSELLQSLARGIGVVQTQKGGQRLEREGRADGRMIR